MWVSYAVKEFTRHKQFSLVVTLNLSLACLCFALVDSFRSSLRQQLLQNSKLLMGADLSVDFSERLATDEEQKYLNATAGENVQRSERISMFTMASSKNGKNPGMLVDLMAIDEHFPLYGSIDLDRKTDSIYNLSKGKPVAWVYEEILQRLDLVPGDLLKIGEAEFVVGAKILNDPPSFGSLFGFSPRIYIDKRHLPATQLIQPLSRYKQQILYKISSQEDVEKTLTTWREKFKNFQDVRATSHHQTGERFSQGIGQVLDYLSLMALIGLLLTAVGCAYLTKNFLLKSKTSLAVLKSLGLKQKKIFAIYFLQLSLVGCLSAAMALLFASLTIPALNWLMLKVLPLGLEVSLPWTTIIKVLGLCLSLTWSIAIPYLAKLKAVDANQLFREELASVDTEWKGWQRFLLWLPFVGVLVALALLQAQSWKVGVVAVVTLASMAAIILGLGFGVLRLAAYLSVKIKAFTWQQATLHLIRKPSETISSLFSLTLASLFLCLVAQLYWLIKQEIFSPTNVRQADLFVIDIQKSQLEPLKTLLAGANLSLANISPMVSANLISINDKSVFGDDYSQEQSINLSTEQHAKRWATRRSQNLSYPIGKMPSEEIISGNPLVQQYAWQDNKPAEISLEQRFAERMGVTVGDVLTFNIQGLEVKSKVVNLRRVKWTTFYPNFFMLMQRGVLEDAPQIYLASIFTNSVQEKLNIQKQIVQKFSNISVVDIGLTLKKILNLIDKMTAIVITMAGFVCLAALAVIYSLWQAQTLLKIQFANILRIIGLHSRARRRIFAIENYILLFVALTIGGSLSFLTSYVFATQLLNLTWQGLFLPTVVVLGGLTVLGGLLQLGKY